MNKFLSLVSLFFIVYSSNGQEKFSKKDIKNRLETIKEFINQDEFEQAFDFFFSMDQKIDLEDIPKSVREDYRLANITLKEKRTLFELNKEKVKDYVRKYQNEEFCSALWLLNLEINKKTAYTKTIELYTENYFSIKNNKSVCDKNRVKLEEINELLNSKSYLEAKTEVDKINPNYLYTQDEKIFKEIISTIDYENHDYEEVKFHIIDYPQSVLTNLDYSTMIYSDAQKLIDELEYIKFKAPILISNLDGDYKKKIEADYNTFLPILKEGILELKSFLKDNPPPYGEDVAKYVKDGFFQIYNPKYKAHYDPSLNEFNLDANYLFDKKVTSGKNIILNEVYDMGWVHGGNSVTDKAPFEEHEYHYIFKDVLTFISFNGSELDAYKYKQTEEYQIYQLYYKYIEALLDTGVYFCKGDLSLYSVENKCFYADFYQSNFFEKNWEIKNRIFIEYNPDINRFIFPANFEKAEEIEDTWVDVPMDDRGGYLKITPIAMYKYQKGSKKLSFLRISLFNLDTNQELITIIFDDPHRQIKSVKEYSGKVIDFTNFTETKEDDYIKPNIAKSSIDLNSLDPDYSIDEIIEEESIFDKESSTVDLNVVQIPPKYPGGEEALYQHISENFVWPSEDIEEGNEGRVFVQFVVNEKGEIEDVKVARGINPRLNSEAISVIKSMPRWSPGYNDGEAVKVRYMIPIVLKLKDEREDSNESSLSLKLSGWSWENPPRENRITHSGQIEFKFLIDEYGEVREIQIISSSFTPEEEKWLKERLASVMFRQTSSGRPPEMTQGTLIWKFRPR